MATLASNGQRFTVQFHPADGTARRTLGLGRCPRRAAEQIRGHVAAIVTSQRHHTALPEATARWLHEMPAALHARLVAKGLAAPRVTVGSVALGTFCEAYITRRTDLKPSTVTILKQTKKSLVEHFGADRDVRTITPGEASDWQRAVRAAGAQATSAKHVKKARQFFADAIDRKLMSENPFRKLKPGTMANPERLVYVPVADVLKVIEASYGKEWPLVFALARFAGARIPSEVRNLQWGDIDLGAGRMTLRSPKTEHHEGKGERIVPIAPELSRLLLEAFEAADEGSVHVLPTLRHTTNISTNAKKVIRRAQLPVWPRTFQNLRSSCETDWAVAFPIHVACAWAGNTQAVAARHYLKVTDDHFARAARGAAAAPGNGRKGPEGAAKTIGKSGENGNSSGPRGTIHLPKNLAKRLRVPRRALHAALQHAAALGLQQLRASLPPPTPRATGPASGREVAG